MRDLHRCHPGEFVTDVRTSCPDLWDHNPYLTPLSEHEPEVEVVSCEYPLIHQSNQMPYHFIHGFRLFLSERLEIAIQPHAFRGDLHLTKQEKMWLSQVDEISGTPGRIQSVTASANGAAKIASRLSTSCSTSLSAS